MQTVVTGMLYALTAIATGVQLWTLLWMSVLGVPIGPLHYVAFFGSIVLFSSCFVAMWKREAGIIAAFFGVVLLWLFYGPALYFFSRKLPDWVRLSGQAFLLLLPNALLICATLITIIGLFKISRRGHAEMVRVR